MLLVMKIENIVHCWNEENWGRTEKCQGRKHSLTTCKWE